MRIAVIGGGIFGVTTAIRLAENHSVDLFEKNSDIFYFNPRIFLS